MSANAYVVGETFMSLQSLPKSQVESQYFVCDNLIKTILVVDDNLQILEMLDLVLTDAGYNVKQASSIDKAIKELITGNVFVLLTDLQMPIANGWDLAILARHYNPDIKIAILTGYDFLAKPPTAGLVDLVIGKPVDIELLVQQIDTL